MNDGYDLFCIDTLRQPANTSGSDTMLRCGCADYLAQIGLDGRAATQPGSNSSQTNL